MDEYLIDRVQEVGRAKQIKAGGQLGVAGPSILKSIDPPPAPILQLEVDGAEFFDKFLHRIAWVTVCPPLCQPEGIQEEYVLNARSPVKSSALLGRHDFGLPSTQISEGQVSQGILTQVGSGGLVARNPDPVTYLSE